MQMAQVDENEDRPGGERGLRVQYVADVVREEYPDATALATACGVQPSTITRIIKTPYRKPNLKTLGLVRRNAKKEFPGALQAGLRRKLAELRFSEAEIAAYLASGTYPDHGLARGVVHLLPDEVIEMQRAAQAEAERTRAASVDAPVAMRTWTLTLPEGPVVVTAPVNLSQPSRALLRSWTGLTLRAMAKTG